MLESIVHCRGGPGLSKRTVKKIVQHLQSFLTV